MTAPSAAAAAPAGPLRPPVRFRPRENWRSPLDFLREVSKNQLAAWPARTYRELIFQHDIPLRGRKAVFLNDPDALKYVLTRHERFPKSELQNRLLRKGLGEGLLTAEIDHWRAQRRAVQPAFKVALLKRLAPSMARAVHHSVDAIAAKTGADDSAPARIDMHHEMMMLTLDVLREAMFQRLNVDNEKMGWAVSQYLDAFGRMDLADYFALPEWLPRLKHWRVRPASRYFDRAVAAILAERRADPSPPDDLLQLMLEARDEETGKGLTDRELRDNLITFFLAGHETTAISLSWSLYLLALHPAAEQRLRTEIENVLGGRPVSAEDIDALPYTRQVFEEAMRLYPPVPMFDRIALHDEELAGRKVEKGSHILISPYVLHRHRLLWDRPNAFDPDRFAPGAAKARHRFQYLPFNAGPRACVGLNFAMMEGVLALAALVQNFRFQLPEDFQPELEAIVTMRPRGGMPMFVTRA